MDFAYSPRVEALRQQLNDFMERYIVPRIGQWHREVQAGQYPVSFMDDLKALARSEASGKRVTETALVIAALDAYLKK